MGIFLKLVDLSFDFPFYGRRVSQVVVATSGAVLMGGFEDEGERPFPVPSHAAPFLSSLPPGDDVVTYHDFGNVTK